LWVNGTFCFTFVLPEYIKFIHMEQYTISINEKDKLGKAFLKYVKEFAQATNNEVVSIKKNPNSLTVKAIEDVRKGKVKKMESVEDFFDSI